MEARIIEKQIKFHWDKVTALEKEYTAVERSERQRILKDEAKLRSKLEAIRKQIDDHKAKIESLKPESPYRSASGLNGSQSGTESSTPSPAPSQAAPRPDEDH